MNDNLIKQLQETKLFEEAEYKVEDKVSFKLKSGNKTGRVVKAPYSGKHTNTTWISVQPDDNEENVHTLPLDAIIGKI